MLAGKQPPQVRMIKGSSFTLVEKHHVQERPQRRTRQVHAAIVEVHLRDALLRGDDIVDAIRENLCILQVGAKHFGSEDRLRMVENAAEECMHETLIDSITQPTRQDTSAAAVEVFTLLQ